MDVAVLEDLRPGEQVVLHLPRHREGGRIQRMRRDRAEVEGLRRDAWPGNLREADAPEPRIPRFHDGEREGRRNRRVGGAAAFGENGNTCLGGIARLGGDHAALAGRARLGDLPVLRHMRGRRPGHGAFLP
jgi:hypothetical protein